MSKKLKKTNAVTQIYSNTNSDIPKTKRNIAKAKRKKNNLLYLKRKIQFTQSK